MASEESGTKYEDLVANFNKKFMKDYFVYKQQKIKPNKKTPKHLIRRCTQLPDFIYLKEGCPDLAIECKNENNKSFNFGRVTSGQHRMLQKFDSRAGVAFVLIGFNGGSKNYLFPYKDYLKFSEIIISQGRKSFNKDKDKELIKQYAKIVDKLPLKKNYYLDLNIIRYF